MYVLSLLRITRNHHYFYLQKGKTPLYNILKLYLAVLNCFTQKMSKSFYFITKYLPYLPIFGLSLYAIVYTYAVANYPGGSTNYPEAIGYSFNHNLLCDAMDPITKGGHINSARFLAVISHIILGLTMITFFYVLPKIFPVKNSKTKLISFFGMAAMAALVFMYTEYHDVIVVITAILGSFAFIPFFIALHRYKNTPYKNIVYLCYVLSIVVFFIFQTKIGVYYLPFIQKVAFIIDACWVIWTCQIVINLNKKSLAIDSKS